MAINFGNNDSQLLPAGIHQILHFNTTSQTQQQNSTAFVNVNGMTNRSITPKSSTKKILVTTSSTSKICLASFITSSLSFLFCAIP